MTTHDSSSAGVDAVPTFGERVRAAKAARDREAALAASDLDLAVTVRGSEDSEPLEPLTGLAAVRQRVRARRIAAEQGTVLVGPVTPDPRPEASPAEAPGVGFVVAEGVVPSVASGDSVEPLARRRPSRRGNAAVGVRSIANRLAGGEAVVLPSGRRMSLSARDVELLVFLARYGAATYEQMAFACGTTVDALRHRMPTLREAGLMKSARGPVAVFAATSTGIALSGLDLPVASLGSKALVHALAVTEAGMRLEVKARELEAQGVEGYLVATRREVEAAAHKRTPTPAMRDQRKPRVQDSAGPQYMLRWAYQRTKQEGLGRPASEWVSGPLVPDLVLVRERRPGGISWATAVHVESRGTKRPAEEWQAKLWAYKRQFHFADVLLVGFHDVVVTRLSALLRSAGIPASRYGVEPKPRNHPTVVAGVWRAPAPQGVEFWYPSNS